MPCDKNKKKEQKIEGKDQALPLDMIDFVCKGGPGSGRRGSSLTPRERQFLSSKKPFAEAAVDYAKYKKKKK